MVLGFQSRARARQGVTAVLAMLYLTLMASLALGFYSASNTAIMVSYNEQRVERARLAAESGLDFARYNLARVSIPQSTPADERFALVGSRLGTLLNGSGNLNKGTIDAGPDTIRIPGDGSFIKSDMKGSEFRLIIQDIGNRQVRVSVVGKYYEAISTSQSRGIRMDFEVTEKSSSVLGFGVASRSPISMDSNARIRGATDPKLGSVLVTSNRTPPLRMNSNSQISGDVTLSSDGWPNLSSNATIAGSSNPRVYGEHVHAGVGDMEFPVIDTDVFKPFATNVISSPNQKFTSGTMRNLYIKANTNPTFDSNMKVEGVVYIETPNRVKFDSNVTVRGVIVVQNDPTGSVSTNSLEFQSNVKLYPVETLPPTKDYPPALRALTGSMILAPKFSVLFNSNFGATGGIIAAGKLDFDSNARGSIGGTIMNLEDTSIHLDGNADIAITAPGMKLPAGLGFPTAYKALPGTYEEIPAASVP